MDTKRPEALVTKIFRIILGIFVMNVVGTGRGGGFYSHRRINQYNTTFYSIFDFYQTVWMPIVI